MASSSRGNDGATEVLKFLTYTCHLDPFVYLKPLVDGGFTTEQRILAMTEQELKQAFPNPAERRKLKAALKRHNAKQDKTSKGRKRKTQADEDGDEAPQPPPDVAPNPPEDVMVNRTPVMLLMGTVVAEALGYDWNEALSLASAMTTLNAHSKAAHLGIYEKGDVMPDNAEKMWLFGREIAFVKHQGKARACDPNHQAKLVSPKQVFNSLSRAYGQHFGTVLRYMRDLVKVVPPSVMRADNNRVAYQIYCKIRPEVPGGRAGWGVQGKLNMSSIQAVTREWKRLTGASHLSESIAKAIGEQGMNTVEKLKTHFNEFETEAIEQSIQELQATGIIYEDANHAFQLL